VSALRLPVLRRRVISEFFRKTVAIILCYATLGATMQAAVPQFGRIPSTRSAHSMLRDFDAGQIRPNQGSGFGEQIRADVTDVTSAKGLAHLSNRIQKFKRTQPVELASLASAPLGIVGQQGTFFQTAGTSSGTYSSIPEDFNKTPIPGSSFIWFSSVLRIGGAGPTTPVRIFLRGSTVRFTANGVAYNINAPDANVIFSTTATKATTSYDPIRNLWTTVVPSSLNDYRFLTGVELPVPSSGLPAKLNPVTWDGYFYSDTPGVSVNWQWAAAVY